MNSEFERFGDGDPTTPMFEGLLPRPTDEAPRPGWEPTGGSTPPPPTSFAPEPLATPAPAADTPAPPAPAEQPASSFFADS